MPWILLVVAGLFEIGFTTCMKKSDGFRQPHWSAGFLVCALVSFLLLALAVRRIPLGTAYAVWTGIGAAGTILVGILFFGESATPVRLLLVATIVGAVIGLRLVEA
jgi:quaternary ammonium compound-resistance protein SugE